MIRHCETCGRFVPKRHPKTARYFYDVDPLLEASVYSLATATKFQERLDCRDCSMDCCRMREAGRRYGVVLHPRLPGGWQHCDQAATQAEWVVVKR